MFKERAKVGEEVEVDRKQWRGSDEARRATGCICTFWGWRTSDGQRYLRTVVWAWAGSGVDEDERAVESGQWAVVSGQLVGKDT